MSEEEIWQCRLKDCGCTPSQIEKFMKANAERQMSILKQHRKAVLQELHALEKQIDCIDYVIHKLEQKEKYT